MVAYSADNDVRRIQISGCKNFTLVENFKNQLVADNEFDYRKNNQKNKYPCKSKQYFSFKKGLRQQPVSNQIGVHNKHRQCY